MNSVELEKVLDNKGLPGPLFLLFGQDHLLKERLVGKFTALVMEGMEDFNLESLLADDTSAGEVVEHAGTLPFMTPPRVVIVRGVDRYSADDLKVFAKYMEDPNEASCLVMIADKPDMRLKFFKDMKAAGTAVSCDPPKGRGLVKWVRDAMERRGVNMNEAAARTLIDRVGTDLNELDLEIEKVYLYAFGKKSVEMEDVVTASRLGQTANVFGLGDAVGGQDAGTALADLKDLLLTEHHLPILAMLVRHFRILLKAKVHLPNGGNSGEAAKVLGVPPFVAGKYMDQARNLSLAQIKKGLADLKKANLTLVTSPAPPKLVMDKLVLDLASLKRSGL